MSANSVHVELSAFTERLLPRMLTQVCRDPGSPGYGSFDRNWWHYKIRDFSSIILQQGGYALHCASRLPQFADRTEALETLAAASCRFWNDRAVKHGAFEEYYPWEQGYPPAAFSSLAVAKMAAEGVVDADEVFQGLEKAAKQLQSRFEPKAANQQVAGTAALCWIRRIAPELVDESVFGDICNRTLACQHEEGWYMEYGGPDLGYLSVTMDCLWDAYDATGDERFKASAAKALGFIAPFAALPQRGAGMHNSRNTDYIVPYGIARFLVEENQASTAALILSRILSDLNSSEHFVQAIDDRYFCHYIGHSFFRAVPPVEGVKPNETRMADFTGQGLPACGRSAGGGMGETAEGSRGVRMDRWFPGTGHWLRYEPDSDSSVLVSAKKGGILSIASGDKAACSDFGWMIKADGQEWVSHWWADFWTFDRKEDRIAISGHLTPHTETVSTPFKHVVLRGLSLVFGHRIIGLLKEKMIFKKNQSAGVSFSRIIELGRDRVEVTDVIGVENPDVPVRAPRSSKRHVASADCYHREDLNCLDTAIETEESRIVRNGCVEITTIYRRK